MLKPNACVLLLLSTTIPCAAQNENAVWLFDHETGIDFMTPPPAVLHDYSEFSRATAVIADEGGSLVLFSDDSHIWNGANEVLVNGDSLFRSSWVQKMQSSLILPWPGHSREFYMIQTYPWNAKNPMAEARS